MTSPVDKQQWRARLLADRRAVKPQVRHAEAESLAGALAGWAGRWSGGAVCAYVPVGTEPGSMALLEVLLEAGCTVLLPVVTGPSALEWAQYRGPESLVPARYGLLEPAGARLGSGAVAETAAVLVPALAVDHHGVRLGRGAGHYDRSLPLVRPGTALVAVVRDAELVQALPAEPHDIRMTAVLTPAGGVSSLPIGAAGVR